jgi:type III secretion protein Q
MHALRDFGMADLHPVALTRDGSGRAGLPDDGWCIARRAERDLFAFRIGALPQQTERRFREAIAALPGRARRGDDLRLVGSVCLATRGVRRALLGTLMPGDVLLLDNGTPTQETRAELRWGRPGSRQWVAPALVDDQHVKIEGEFHMEDDSLETAPLEDAAPNALSALEVGVRFEIDTISMPLSGVEQLAPGQVVQLSAPLESSQLRLVACGRVIGNAELVVVGDRLGARIVHMVKSHAAELER